MADIYKRNWYNYSSEIEDILEYIKDFLDDNKSGYFSSVEVTTNSYSEPCVKITLPNNEYYTISYSDDITGEGYNLVFENFTTKDQDYITTDTGKRQSAGVGRYVWKLSSISYYNPPIWCIAMDNCLIVTSIAHIGVKTTNDFDRLSFVLFRKDGSVINQSYPGVSYKCIYSMSEVIDSGKINVNTPFIKSNGSMLSDIFVVQDYGSGSAQPFAKPYSTSGGVYYDETPTRLSVGEDTYIVLGGLAIKE